MTLHSDEGYRDEAAKEFADTTEVSMIIVAAFASMAIGTVNPFAIQTVGDVLSGFMGGANGNNKLYDKSIIFGILGFMLLFLTYISRALWVLSAESQIKRISVLYLTNVLHKDSAWFGLTPKMVKQSSDAYSVASSVAEQAISGVRTIFAFSMQKRPSRTVSKTDQKKAFASGFAIGAFQGVLFLIFAFGFWFGGQMVNKDQIPGDKAVIVLLSMIMLALSLLDIPVALSNLASAREASDVIYNAILRSAIEAVLNAEGTRKNATLERTLAGADNGDFICSTVVTIRVNAFDEAILASLVQRMPDAPKPDVVSMVERDNMDSPLVDGEWDRYTAVKLQGTQPCSIERGKIVARCLTKPR
ncbi:uncharacterized protein EV422DRAFT_578271 [Fimicolochytrium jonesii]|uniref:uncharacterized protein n=1 Tax=Fimicolochytrium jonesii TaxID=1396493 RepID=UPI0022FDDDDC|nr:uncharacterized protein EV422DRAFT_578271 [Fimicolochytrium jonesii]KAI8821447.1 hypothetical protein EV422DRAFT_578271 [Fimicolochytrium jonesii]